MDKAKRILIFTGGGLAPALNASLYGAITEAKKSGCQVYGGLFGWHCFLPKGKIFDLTNLDIESIKNQGGTFLRSSRTDLRRIEGGLDSLKNKVKELGIDCIMAIGGNDTLGLANYVFKNLNLPVVGIPKTIDNDLFETYWSPGFPTAAYRLAKIIADIKKDAAYSLARVFIVESLGLDAGWLTAAACYGQADLIIPPEREAKLDDILALLEKKYRQNGDFAVIVIAHQVNFDKLDAGVADNNFDSFRVKRKIFTSLSLRDTIKEKLGLDCKALLPGNYLQSGQPIEIDREFAVKLGQRAVAEAVENNFGVSSFLKKPSGGKIQIDVTSLDKLVPAGEVKKLDETLFDFSGYQPKPAFFDYLKPILGPVDSFLGNKTYNQLINQIGNKF